MAVRIGLGAGGIVAGVIGERRFAYDLRGDAVNLAARLEAPSAPGQIQMPSPPPCRPPSRCHRAVRSNQEALV
ncbi:MAG: adenylate/guanylate cyclase domain-containing protein [Pseudomonadota bacterium]